jgi:hypothetical protein
MKNTQPLWSGNRKEARSRFGGLTPELLRQLKSLSSRFHLEISLGEVQLLDRRWYVTHSGLMSIAQRNKCAGITSAIVQESSDPSSRRWVFQAIVYPSPGSIGFSGLGDADPGNVSSAVLGSKLRIAETRAVNRALRKAYGIGLCSIEELGSSAVPQNSRQKLRNHSHTGNGDLPKYGQPRLRDRLCLLVRQHELDPELVKRYAASFCGTETVSDASRDLVENFIQSLAKEAKTNPDALTCKLNSFRVAAEVNS